MTRGGCRRWAAGGKYHGGEPWRRTGTVWAARRAGVGAAGAGRARVGLRSLARPPAAPGGQARAGRAVRRRRPRAAGGGGRGGGRGGAGPPPPGAPGRLAAAGPRALHTGRGGALRVRALRGGGAAWGAAGCRLRGGGWPQRPQLRLALL